MCKRRAGCERPVFRLVCHVVPQSASTLTVEGRGPDVFRTDGKRRREEGMIEEPAGTRTGPTAQQIDLFRAVEDVHELTGAIVVLLTDAESVSIAVAGDEDELPPPLRALLGGKQLAAAGSVRALLEPISEELGDTHVNYSILALEKGHVLTIAFDAEANFDVVQTVGREASQMISEILTSAPN